MLYYDLPRGSIALCHFPHSESPAEPGPVVRPCLIVRQLSPEGPGAKQVVVAYGTSRRTKANLGFEIRVNHPDSLSHAGLLKPTRFTLSRMRVLPATSDYFQPVRSGNPILGSLEDTLQDRLDGICEVMAGIAAPLSILQRKEANAIQTRAAGHLDEFLQRHCAGRADLNGLRKRR